MPLKEGKSQKTFSSTGKASLPIPGEDTLEDDIQTSRTDDDRTFSTGKKSDGSSGTLDNY